MYQFCYYFLLYFMYCVLGYVIECGYCSLKNRKIIFNRGFLIGPYLPIYGNGAMIIIIFLKKYLSDLLVFFVMSCVTTTFLEYITSYLMEKIFKARWWDYSERKLNINGRVCLENTLLFGIGSVFIMYLINPYFESILLSLSKNILITFSLIFLFTYIVDTTFSLLLVYKISKTSVFIKKDVSDQINNKIHNLLKKNFNLKIRLINAFPSIKKQDLYKKISEIINKSN